MSGWIELAELGELLRPADAAHDALGVFQVEHGVAAGGARLGVLRVRMLDRGDHAADHDLGAVFQGGRLDGGVRAIGLQLLGMLGQRMARHVEAQHFLLLGQAVLLLPFGQVGQVLGDRFDRFLFFVVEEPLLPAAAVGGRRGAALQGAIDGGEPLRPPPAQRIEGPRLHQRLDGRAIDLARVEPLAEVEEAAIGPARLAGLDDRGRGGAAAALDGREGIEDLAVADGELDVRAVDVRRLNSRFIRWQSSMCSTSESFFLKFRPGMSLESKAAMNSTL